MSLRLDETELCYTEIAVMSVKLIGSCVYCRMDWCASYVHIVRRFTSASVHSGTSVFESFSQKLGVSMQYNSEPCVKSDEEPRPPG